VALEQTSDAVAPVARHVLPIDEQPALDEAEFLIPPELDRVFDVGPQPKPT